MEPNACKVVNTHDNEISGCTIQYRILYSSTPHPEGMNGDAQSDLTTLEFKNREQFEYFYSIILRLQ